MGGHLTPIHLQLPGPTKSKTEECDFCRTTKQAWVSSKHGPSVQGSAPTHLLQEAFPGPAKVRNSPGDFWVYQAGAPVHRETPR